jgi:hypothetical protein
MMNWLFVPAAVPTDAHVTAVLLCVAVNGATPPLIWTVTTKPFPTPGKLTCVATVPTADGKNGIDTKVAVNAELVGPAVADGEAVAVGATVGAALAVETTAGLELEPPQALRAQSPSTRAASTSIGLIFFMHPLSSDLHSQ